MQLQTCLHVINTHFVFYTVCSQLHCVKSFYQLSYVFFFSIFFLGGGVKFAWMHTEYRTFKLSPLNKSNICSLESRTKIIHMMLNIIFFHRHLLWKKKKCLCFADFLINMLCCIIVQLHFHGRHFKIALNQQLFTMLRGFLSSYGRWVWGSWYLSAWM